MQQDRTRSKPVGLPIIHPVAAGIDIGARFHVVAVSPDLCDEPVQTFLAFTSDLQRMADWLVAMGTKTVVMESTGVYWVAAYEVLAALVARIDSALCESLGMGMARPEYNPALVAGTGRGSPLTKLCPGHLR
jgi:hypothetical protein